MSHYGPTDRPYQGQPQDPWQGRQPPQEPYDQPSDPWSGQDPWGGAPASTPPGAPGSPSPAGPGYGYDSGYGQPASPPGGYDTGYGTGTGYAQGYDSRYDQQQSTAPAPAPVWSPTPPPPAKRKTSTPLLAAVVVLAILVLGGGGVAGYYLLKDDSTTPTPPTTSGTTTTAAPATPTPATTTPGGSPVAATDARFATKGQCLVNKGSDAKPTMQIAKCGTGTYEVLARFDGTKDYAGKCGKVPGYQFYYYFDGKLDTLDFVLCLKKR